MTVATAPTDVEAHKALVKSETLRCMHSRRHFAEYAKVRDPHGGIVPFEYWPHLALLDEIEREHRLVIVLKGRQEGLSWWMALGNLHTVRFREASRVLELSINELEATELLEKSKFILRHLPPWLANTPDVTDNTTRLGFERRESAIRALPATEDAGSGETATRVCCDEHAKHRFARANYTAYKPTIDAGGSLWLVSTAKGMGGLFHEVWLDAAQPGFDIHPSGAWVGKQPGDNGFLAVFLPWSVRPGRDAAWYERQRREYRNTPELLAQEYPSTPEEAFIQSGRPVFPGVTSWSRPTLATPEALAASTIVYAHPKPRGRYLIGADPAQGLAHGDRSAAVVLEMDDLGRATEVAHLCGTHDPDTFAAMLDGLGRHYRGALLGVERNNHGHAVLSALRRLASTEYRLYAEQPPLKEPTPRGVVRAVGLAGWNTTAGSKPVMISELAAALRVTMDDEGKPIGPPMVRVSTPALLAELLAYQREDDGDTNAPEGRHDDRVIALAIAWQMQKWDAVHAGYRPGAVVVRGLPGQARR